MSKLCNADERLPGRLTAYSVVGKHIEVDATYSVLIQILGQSTLAGMGRVTIDRFDFYGKAKWHIRRASPNELKRDCWCATYEHAY